MSPDKQTRPKPSGGSAFEPIPPRQPADADSGIEEDYREPEEWDELKQKFVGYGDAVNEDDKRLMEEEVKSTSKEAAGEDIPQGHKDEA